MKKVVLAICMLLIATQAMAAMNWSDSVEYIYGNLSYRTTGFNYLYGGWTYTVTTGLAGETMPEDFSAWNGQYWLPDPHLNHTGNTGGNAIRLTVDIFASNSLQNDVLLYKDFTTGVNPGDLVTASAWVATVDQSPLYGFAGFGAALNDYAGIIVSELDAVGNVIAGTDHEYMLGGAATWSQGDPNNPWRQVGGSFVAGTNTHGLRYTLAGRFNNSVIWDNALGNLNLGLRECSGWATFDDLSLTVPEPGSILALFGGLIGLVGTAIRKKS